MVERIYLNARFGSLAKPNSGALAKIKIKNGSTSRKVMWRRMGIFIIFPIWIVDLISNSLTLPIIIDFAELRNGFQ